MLILGLTGGIATGKSTVSHYLSEKYHIPIIDADKIAREIVEPGTPCFKAIVDHFKPLIPDITIIDENGNTILNRSALGAFVFANKKELKVLNSITHPAVRKRILYLLFKSYISNDPVVILDIPLLFESGMDWLCSRTLTISCNSKTQLERLLSRNSELTKEQASNRINSQMDLSKKLKLSDYVINNDFGLKELEENVDNFVKTNLLALNVNKDIGWNYKISLWWNWYQLIFPPFAFAGAIAALIRKWISKCL
ncbi:hypothetical protein C6P40_000559 [Pichia californica]|uniref:Dephospho-CoA kinase n=1 Tax=Pichia californica TaxID=460514 RepID=A0A9P6WKQ8_9ASCO|nr:hypothetical protein C6P40_000559 [[Candida] californica]